MKKIIVTERVPCFQIWTYEVEAETEEDAIKQVIAGTAEVVESIVEEHEDDDISDDIVELERGENNK
jgi:hypothetical protein